MNHVSVFLSLNIEQRQNVFCVNIYLLVENSQKSQIYNLLMFVLLFFSGSRSSKTFKPKKNIPEGTHQYDLMKHAAATLGSGNLRLAVMLPEGEDLNEWVAVNSKSKRFSIISLISTKSKREYSL